MTPNRSFTDGDPSAPGVSRKLLLGLALLCLGLALAAIWHLYPADQRSIKHTVEKLVSAAQRRDLVAGETLISADYRDGRGLTHDTVLRQLFLYLDARGFREITPQSIAVGEVVKGSVQATAKLWLAQAEGPAMGRRDAVQLDLSLRREQDGWRVTSVEDWELPEDDFNQSGE